MTSNSNRLIRLPLVLFSPLPSYLTRKNLACFSVPLLINESSKLINFPLGSSNLTWWNQASVFLSLHLMAHACRFRKSSCVNAVKSNPFTSGSPWERAKMSTKKQMPQTATPFRGSFLRQDEQVMKINWEHFRNPSYYYWVIHKITNARCTASEDTSLPFERFSFALKWQMLG